MAISTPNAIALITKYSTEGFDKVYKAEAVSSVLSRDSALVRFTGAKTVKVAKISLGGLSNYYRNNVGDPRVEGVDGGKGIDAPYATGDSPYFGAGYREAPAALTWEERTIRMDRASKYVIEKFDDEESGGLLVGNILTEVNRTQMVPEVDAYCFSEIYKNAGHIDNNSIGSGANAKPLEALNAGLTYLEKCEVPADNQIIFMSPDYLNALRNTPELTKFMQQGDYEKNVSFRMTKYEGRQLIIVPPLRFKSDYVFGDRGFWASATAVDIDFIVMDKEAAVHVVKFQQTKILSGNEALIASNMDGFVLYARVYHDLFVFDNKKVGIYVKTGSGVSAIAVPTDNVANTVVRNISGAVYLKDNVVRDIVTFPGDKFATIFYTSETPTLGTSTLGATTSGTVIGFADTTLVHVGDTIASADQAKIYLADATGTIVAKVSAVAA